MISDYLTNYLIRIFLCGCLAEGTIIDDKSTIWDSSNKRGGVIKLISPIYVYGCDLTRTKLQLHNNVVSGKWQWLKKNTEWYKL